MSNEYFLMIKDTARTDQNSAAPATGMVVVLNWTAELKQRVPMR
jgi:hypothetical protein